MVSVLLVDDVVNVVVCGCCWGSSEILTGVVVVCRRTG